jgi:3-methylcrotonyl-CoA carboxylase alpha subunit
MYEVVGVTTNLDLLRAVAASPAFLAADLDTGFIGRHISVESTVDVPDAALAAAGFAVLSDRRVEVPADPWDMRDSFRLNTEGDQEILLRAANAVIGVRAVWLEGGAYRLRFGDRSVVVRAEADGISVDDVPYRTRVVRREDELTAIHRGRNFVFTLVDPLMPPGARGAGEDRVMAPIPARVTHVLVQAGDKVTKGSALIVL